MRKMKERVFHAGTPRIGHAQVFDEPLADLDPATDQYRQKSRRGVQPLGSAAASKITHAPEDCPPAVAQAIAPSANVSVTPGAAASVPTAGPAPCRPLFLQRLQQQNLRRQAEVQAELQAEAALSQAEQSARKAAKLPHGRVALDLVQASSPRKRSRRAAQPTDRFVAAPAPPPQIGRAHV